MKSSLCDFCVECVFAMSGRFSQVQSHIVSLSIDKKS